MGVARCVVCGSEDVVFEERDGTFLCAQHFIKRVERKVFKRLRGVVKGKECIVAGVSGGKDSAVLLYVLKKWQQTLGFQLLAVTVDEGTAYRRKLVEVAKELTTSLNVPHVVIAFKELLGKTLDEVEIEKKCTLCAQVRRRVLDLAAITCGGVVAVGHNEDDVAQSILMNLMRNEPQRLLSTLFPKRLPHLPGRIRPLSDVSELEVLTYAYLKQLPFVHERCPYSLNNEVRTRVRQALFVMNGKALSNTALIRSVETLLKHSNMEYKDSEACERCGFPASGRVCKLCALSERLHLPLPAQWRVVVEGRVRAVMSKVLK
jgi:uncharacterized protein (TIGR00269 family)